VPRADWGAWLQIVLNSARGSGQDGGVDDGCLVLQGRQIGAAELDQIRALLVAHSARG
jgi:hypothetical protein